jgi:hypothetical protein
MVMKLSLRLVGSIPFRVVTQKYGKGIVEYDDIVILAGDIYLGLDLTHPVDINGTNTFDGYIGMSGGTTASATTFVACMG